MMRMNADQKKNQSSSRSCACRERRRHRRRRTPRPPQRTRGRPVGRQHKESNAQKRTICRQLKESRRGFSGSVRSSGGRQGSMPSTTKTVGLSLFPTGTQLCQPSKEGTGHKEVEPVDGKATSTPLQPDRTNGDNNDLRSDMTRLPQRKTTRNGTLWKVIS